MIPLATAGTGRLWLPLAGGALVLGLLMAGLYLAYDHGWTVERADWQARWTDRDAYDQKVGVLAKADTRRDALLSHLKATYKEDLPEKILIEHCYEK